MSGIIKKVSKRMYIRPDYDVKELDLGRRGWNTDKGNNGVNARE